MAIDTLLFDLDGTLVDQYRPGSTVQFARLVLRRFRGLASPIALVRAGQLAIRAMKANTTTRTNFDVIVSAFCDQTGAPPGEVAERLQRLLREDFLAMAWRFHPVPGAGDAVRLARKLGFHLVLATNPTVPLPSIVHRLRWAGLGDVAWEFVTHPENMSRCKPSVDYYRQILKALDRPAERCLMIGNDFRKDLPAMEAGIKAFLVDRPMSRTQRQARESYRPDHAGSFADLTALLLEWHQAWEPVGSG